jgi:uncharacterized protein (DUF2267 family)
VAERPLAATLVSNLLRSRREGAIMTHDELLEEVAAHAGLSSPIEAERALAAVLGMLAGRLSHAEAEALAEALPAALGAPLRAGRYHGELDRDEWIAHVARREGTTRGFAVEHTLSVCQVLAEALPPEVLERVRRALPGPLAALFTPSPVGRAPVVERPAHSGHTLAEGRPGSLHPLSEAARESAHSQSVVRAVNPHADTKLSTSRGLTQEREAESLATGRPGSSRPLGGFKPKS